MWHRSSSRLWDKYKFNLEITIYQRVFLLYPNLPTGHCTINLEIPKIPYKYTKIFSCKWNTYIKCIINSNTEFIRNELWSEFHKKSNAVFLWEKFKMAVEMRPMRRPSRAVLKTEHSEYHCVHLGPFSETSDFRQSKYTSSIFL